MQLTYHGIPDLSPFAAPSLEAAETGIYLGKTHKIVQSLITFRQLPEELTYRGMRYTK